MNAALATRAGPTWLYAFVALQVICQAALLLPLGSGRTALRVVTFAGSIAMLVMVPAGGRPHPLRELALAVMVVLSLGMLHPQLNSTLAGAASVALNLSIWGPVFWAVRVHIDTRSLHRAVLILFAFHTASATVGVLQVYDPDRFAPDATFIEELLGEFAEGLKLTLDDGRQIYRPFGLTDSPGGASGSGAFAATVGLLLTTASGAGWWLRVIGAMAVAVGMFCIYICQLRSALIVTCLGFLFIIFLAVARGRTTLATARAVVVVGAVLGAFLWVTAIGGQAVITRLETLLQDDAATAYQKNRGIFLEATVEDIPEYPFGAGLGRWGMMHGYFGDRANPNSPPLWVEIQATAWLYDGGVPLLVLGYMGVVGACLLSVWIALRAQDGALADMAAVVAATNVSALTSTFGYAYFISQGGMMFWVLNAALYVAAATESDRLGGAR